MPHDGSIRSGGEPGKVDAEMAKQVVTYQLAYITSREVSLCAECVERDDHDCGVLGPVQHGQHRGYCDGCARKAEAITDTQVRALREQALAASDYRQVDVCDVALATHETSDSQGAELVDSDGHPTTRTEARAECARVLAAAAAMDDSDAVRC